MSSTGYMPDAFVVEGPKAGGHLGFSPEHIVDPNYALEQLVPQVVEAVKPLEDKAGRAIPVIAAGGVYTGEDIKKYMVSARPASRWAPVSSPPTSAMPTTASSRPTSTPNRKT